MAKIRKAKVEQRAAKILQLLTEAFQIKIKSIIHYLVNVRIVTITELNKCFCNWLNTNKENALVYYVEKCCRELKESRMKGLKLLLVSLSFTDRIHWWLETNQTIAKFPFLMFSLIEFYLIQFMNMLLLSMKWL